MSQSLKRFYTEEEYLAQEELALDRHEYYDGQIYLMSGGTDTHDIIGTNITALCRQLLRSTPCRVFSSNMRVKSSHLFTYPDASIVCGPTTFEPGRRDTITNPVVLVEVLSPSTQKYDQSAKFELYKGIESFTDYLIVAQDRVLVKHYHKEADGNWALQQYSQLENAVTLPQVAIALSLELIYEDITF